MSNFNNWIAAFISEKGIDLEQILIVEGESGPNRIPVGCVIEQIQAAPRSEQAQIKNMLVKIDFKNGDVLHFIKHLAKAMAI